ncbi:MAG: type 4a pilus biogenesis protein PilO [Gemmatimonadota bacterium]|jgi:type IV pilus assembly protein PilO|nr:hypothetical protein [Gemmatimonadota bacterium]MDP6529294.1 type 4a pilus biogenesis protein PilO [Gemmatimonadota bacterium]MDP6802179.1 type 4a pilus biogenesis protein PilO [Gemmatimonadota bacterium]
MPGVDFRDPSVQVAGLVVLVSLTVAYLFFAGSLFPFGYAVRSAEITLLEEEYEKLSADLVKGTQSVGRLSEAKVRYEKVSAMWEETRRLLPEKTEMAPLLSQMTLAGQRAGIEFLHFEPKPARPKEVYSEHPVAVRVQGGYHEVGEFLGRVSNLPRIVNIASMKLKTVRDPLDPEAGEEVEAELELAAYTLLSEGERERLRARANGGGRR